MKKYSKKIIALLLVVMMMAPMCTGMVFAADNDIKVMSDGKYLSFTDAKPVMVNNRVMVPFRAIFNAFGATVNFETDDNGNKISASLDGTTVSFYTDNNELSITKNGETTVKTMDAAPFIDSKTNRTMVSARFISEALGKAIGWDSANKSVIIIDFSKLEKIINEKFSILAKASSAETYPEFISFLMTGSFTIDYTEAETNEAMSMKFDANGVSSMNKSDFKLNMDITSSDTSLNINKISIDYKLDVNSNSLYIRSPLFATAGLTFDGKQVTDNTWLKFSLDEMFSTIYGKEAANILMSLMKSGSSNISINDFIKTAFPNEELLTTDTYSEIIKEIDVAETFIGDKAFTDTRRNGRSAKIATLNSEKIFSLLLNYNLLGDIKPENIKAMAGTKELPQINYDLVIYTDNGNSIADIDCCCTFSIKPMDTDEIKGSFSLEQRRGGLDIMMKGDFSIGTMIKAAMDINQHSTALTGFRELFSIRSYDPVIEVSYTELLGLE
jgi:hypothetical protein